MPWLIFTEISETTTPTTAAAPARRSDGATNVADAGRRSLISVFHHPAAYESISSTDSGAADFNPRSVPRVTGKNARKAPRRQAAIHFWSPRSRLHEARTNTRTGAMPMIGIVWLITRYGIKARSTTLKRDMNTASTTPMITPSTNAARATRNEYHVALATTPAMFGVPGPFSGSPRRVIMSQTCGISLSPVRGNSFEAEDLAPVRRPDRLVALPQQGDEGERHREHDQGAHARPAGPLGALGRRRRRVERIGDRRGDRDTHDFARTASATAGMTFSP